MESTPMATICWTRSAGLRRAAGISARMPPNRRNTWPTSSSHRRRIVWGSLFAIASVDVPFTGASEPRLRDIAQRLEAGALAQEREVHGAGWAVSLFGDDDLRLSIPLGGIGLVDLGAVDEEHQVRVLLDRAGLAEIRENRALAAAAGLHGAGELGETDDRNLELLREGLERPGDRRDLLLAVLGRFRPAHELEVVDDDEPRLDLGG